MTNQAQLDKLCGYIADKGPRLCGRVVKILPKGLAEIQAKGKSPKTFLASPHCALRAEPIRPGLGRAGSSILMGR